MFKAALIVLLFFSVTSLYADEGCYIGNRIYFNQTGTVTFLGLDNRKVYDPNIFYEDYTGFCSGTMTYANRTSKATQGLLSTPILCGFSGDNYGSAVRGYVWEFDVIVCSLDSYISILLLGSISCGVCFIRFRK